MGQVGFPAADEGLRAGDGDFAIIHFDCENAMTLGKGEGHQGRDSRHINLQRIDSIKGLVGFACEPTAEHVDIQRFAGARLVGRRLACYELQRMQADGFASRSASQHAELFGGLKLEPALGNQSVQYVGQLQRAVAARYGQIPQVIHPCSPRSQLIRY